MFARVAILLRAFVLCVVASPIVLSAGGEDASPALLGSVRDVRRLTDEDYARHLPFCLTGLVIDSNSNGCHLLMNDGACAFWTRKRLVTAGDIVRARGFTQLESFTHEPQLNLTNATVVGRGTVPEPTPVTPERLLSGDYDYQCVRIKGFFVDAFDDDIDQSYVLAIFNAGGHLFSSFARKKPDTLARLRALVNTDIELTCWYAPYVGGKRRFTGPILGFGLAADNIRLLQPPAADIFDAPSLGALSRMRADDLVRLKRHVIRGEVLAVWRRRHVLLAYGPKRVTRLVLAADVTPPRPGDWIDAVGFPETDLFNINLSNVHIRPAPRGEARRPEAEPTAPGRIRRHPWTGRFDADYQGRLIRLKGIVRSLPRPDQAGGLIVLDCDGETANVDASAVPGVLDRLQIGCVVEMTGVCNLESESWQPRRILPTITDFTLILRTADDVRILSHPPWLTPARVGAMLIVLSLVLVVLLAWNRILRRLVERRSRELTRAQAAQVESELRIDERTRIAAELHDYLAQNLTAVSYRLTTARAALQAGGAVGTELEAAAGMLDSSRTELRRCLWDLKSRALEEPTFELAIRRSLQQITAFDRIDLAFDVPRARVSDPTAHALLSVIRELVANAVNHGGAARITIRGEIAGGELTITVADNGVGFDVEKAAASENGHFGLDGIRQRLRHLNGTFDIVSQPGAGTQAVVRLPLHPDTRP